MNKKISLIVALMILGTFFMVDGVSAQTNTVCCEQTNSGAFCQNVPSEECAPNSRQVPTSCDATSFCRAGTCYDSTEGTCADNTPQLVCNQNGGIWTEESPPQCELGCCTLGNQASFVSLVRCKRLSAFLGLQTNYDKSIKSEIECVASVQSQDVGACVFENEFERNCEFTTKGECDAKQTDTEFYKDKLCSAEELATICGPTTETTCVLGKDEVYFKDTCGNPANIYDASKVQNQEYWTNVRRKDDSCGFGQGNGDSKSCGNCDYLQGSFCRDEKSAGTSPTYGNFICADLNCKDDQGNDRNHGESWCVSDNKEGDGKDSVGSRAFRYICMNGEVVSEPCADFRNEICIENKVETDSGEFSQAACRVNRWQDCLAQTAEDDCLNTDRRDCFWDDKAILPAKNGKGVCLPITSPGLNFWNSEETKAICSQASIQCVVTFEKGLLGGESCKENCDCLTDGWIERQGNVCSSIGDCGPNVNWIGSQGYKKGYEYSIDGQKQNNK
ncbi:hypothetical protein AUJ84_00225 [Candidatus Pacearchaeota archaeon CG1_02_32_132]|nr:MAG: hypothetical protein AUJ84_00225 [Candidatus Pacearchaeota archaeon CG1_02_32_132]